MHVTFSIKAVPGAKRDAIVGMLGDRLKVRIAAPPEGGKANAAICELLARTLGVRARDVEITRGHASPEKTVRVRGLDPATVRERLLLPPSSPQGPRIPNDSPDREP